MGLLDDLVAGLGGVEDEGVAEGSAEGHGCGETCEAAADDDGVEGGGLGRLHV